MDNGRKRNALLSGLSDQNRTWNSIRTGLLTAIAVMLVMSAVMGSAWAYFTTYAVAKGGVTLQFGHEDRITEGFSSWEKTLNIASTDDSRPVYLRMKAFCADYEITFGNDENWESVGDWMYYKEVLQPGTSLADSGDELKVKISGVPENTAEGVKNGDTFNVIVIYESTEVQYNADGSTVAPWDADWDTKVDTSRTSATLGGDD